MLSSYIAWKCVRLSTDWRLHKSWMIMILVLPILQFIYIVFIKMKAGSLHTLGRWCGIWLRIISAMTLFIYLFYILPEVVNDKVCWRSNQKETDSILDVLFTYFVSMPWNFRLTIVPNHYITDESLSSIANLMHHRVHLLHTYENRNLRKLNLLKVMYHINNHNHQ